MPPIKIGSHIETQYGSGVVLDIHDSGILVELANNVTIYIRDIAPNTLKRKMPSHLVAVEKEPPQSTQNAKIKATTHYPTSIRCSRRWMHYDLDWCRKL